MVIHLFLKAKNARVLAVCLLFVLLSGCASQNPPTSGATTTPIPATPTPRISSTPTTNLNNSLTPNPTGVSIDKAGLHTDVAKGIQCPSDALSIGTPANPGPVDNIIPSQADNLVLTGNPLTYDSSELQQIQDYVTAFTPQGAGYSSSAQIPDTLRWVLGGPIGKSRFFNIGTNSSDYSYDCEFEMQLTNTSQNTIQIASVGAQLTGSPQQNTYQYQLIDICTVPHICLFGGGPSTCNVDYATIQLNGGSADQVFSAPPVAADTSCGELTLQPGNVETLDVFFYSPQNLIYSVVPQLVLDTSGGQNTLPLPEMTSTLAFANGSQFTCYGLQGGTFAVETTLPQFSDCL
jgi:hypothetical protein